MPKKKKDEEVEGLLSEETSETAIKDTGAQSAGGEALAAMDSPSDLEADPTAPLESLSAEASGDESAPVGELSGENSARMDKKSAGDTGTEDDNVTDAEPSILGSVAKAALSVLESAAVTIGKGAAKVVSVVGDNTGSETPVKHSKRAEKIGIVASDKMTKTVTVRVDRLVKHPVYRKYVKKRKKFMAHDDLGAKIGDKVKIVETRPMSARKRWRVVEILHKAEL